MKTHDLNSWDGFRPLIQEIRNKYSVGNHSEKNTILFRGHANHCWPLGTTLERCSEKQISVQRYMRHALGCSCELESLTGRKWNLPDYSHIEMEILDKQSPSHVHLPCYDYLVYLRHHGFPSPLLDWTASPYVAAYFAYFEKPLVDRVAVYVYIETPRGFKSWTEHLPFIQVLGPYVSTHSRHFAQKAWYTIATQYDPKAATHVFCPHSAIFNVEAENQDVLVKITMPSGDRIKALEELNDYNINHFTLFQTEDALVRALAIKEFELEPA